MDTSRMDHVLDMLHELRHEIGGTDTKNGSSILDRVNELAKIVGELADVMRDKLNGAASTSTNW